MPIAWSGRDGVTNRFTWSGERSRVRTGPRHASLVRDRERQYRRSVCERSHILGAAPRGCSFRKEPTENSERRAAADAALARSLDPRDSVQVSGESGQCLIKVCRIAHRLGRHCIKPYPSRNLTETAAIKCNLVATSNRRPGKCPSTSASRGHQMECDGSGPNFSYKQSRTYSLACRPNNLRSSAASRESRSGS